MPMPSEEVKQIWKRTSAVLGAPSFETLFAIAEYPPWRTLYRLMLFTLINENYKLPRAFEQNPERYLSPTYLYTHRYSQALFSSFIDTKPQNIQAKYWTLFRIEQVITAHYDIDQPLNLHEIAHQLARFILHHPSDPDDRMNPLRIFSGDQSDMSNPFTNSEIQTMASLHAQCYDDVYTQISRSTGTLKEANPGKVSYAAVSNEAHSAIYECTAKVIYEAHLMDHDSMTALTHRSSNNKGNSIECIAFMLWAEDIPHLLLSMALWSHKYDNSKLNKAHEERRPAKKLRIPGFDDDEELPEAASDCTPTSDDDRDGRPYRGPLRLEPNRSPHHSDGFSHSDGRAHASARAPASLSHRDRDRDRHQPHEHARDATRGSRRGDDYNRHNARDDQHGHQSGIERGRQPERRPY